MHPKDTIPYGYCHCGCGQKTKLAKQSFTERGHVNGEPIPYIHGHNARGNRSLDPDATEKLCPSCGVVKLMGEFGIHRKSADGRNSWCKECYRAYHREHYRKNREVHYERTQAWQRANPDAVRAMKRRRHAAERGATGPFSAAEWKALCDLYDHRCLMCGRKEPDIKLTADHVIPVSKGGAHDISNIQPLCHSCNCRKNTRIIDLRTKGIQQLTLLPERTSNT